jgi:hypothetical protein
MNWSVRNYFAAAMVLGATAAQAAVPYPTAATPKRVGRAEVSAHPLKDRFGSYWEKLAASICFPLLLR